MSTVKNCLVVCILIAYLVKTDRRDKLPPVWLGVVAAGVLAYGVHDLQEAGRLPGLHGLAFDISGTIPKDSWYGTLLKGVFNFQSDPTVLQLVVWLACLVPTLAVFFGLFGGRTTRKPVAPEPAA